MAKKLPVENLHFVAWEERVAAGEIHGQVGRMAYSEDGRGVVCHLCGREYVQLTRTHVQKHGLGSADAYRELLGLNRNQPLSSPARSQACSEHSKRTGTVRHILAHRKPFVPGTDPRRSVPRRRQWGVQVRDRRTRKRTEGQLPPSTSGLEPNQRRVNRSSGRINVNGTSYYFGKGAEGPVTITEVTGEKITVRGRLRDGTTRVKIIPRKR